MLTRTLTLVAVVGAPSLAVAQVGPTPEPPMAAAAAAAPDAAAPDAAREDANIDRGFLMSTAHTHPAGSVVFNNYELFWLGLTYAATDNLQLTVNAMVPISEEFQMGALSGKLKLVDTGQLKVAAFGTLLLVSVDLDEGGSEMETATILGGVASLCTDESCHSTLSATISAGFDNLEDEGRVPLIYGVSLVHKVSRRVKLLLEVDNATVFGDEVEPARGFLVGYGVRFFSGEIAGDVGLIKPFAEDLEDDDSFPLGFPFVNFTYRAF